MSRKEVCVLHYTYCKMIGLLRESTSWFDIKISDFTTVVSQQWGFLCWEDSLILNQDNCCYINWPQQLYPSPVNPSSHTHVFLDRSPTQVAWGWQGLPTTFSVTLPPLWQNKFFEQSTDNQDESGYNMTEVYIYIYEYMHMSFRFIQPFNRTFHHGIPGSVVQNMP